jgi:hypothetical protein
MMGIFISELGSESSLKLVLDNDGLSGLILWEHDAKRVMTIAEIIICVVIIGGPKDSFGGRQ